MSIVVVTSEPSKETVISTEDKTVVAPFLKPGESVKFEGIHSKARNHNNYRFIDFSLHGSVVPTIVVPVTLITLWSALITIMFQVVKWKILSVPNQLITTMSVVLGLLLVFRTNTAYDRYWEARRLWGSLIAQSRNLSRSIWVSVKSETPQQIDDKHVALDLILAFSIATKHHLREESGVYYDDLFHLVSHIPSLLVDSNISLPLEIIHEMSSYVNSKKLDNSVDLPTANNFATVLSSMVDVFSNFERIRNAPVPKAYTLHLKQTIMVYLVLLPFQVLTLMRWLTIPLILITSFIFLGIEAIGTEIENPFGYDANDLRMDVFCSQLARDIEQVRAQNPVNSYKWQRVIE